MLLATPDAKLAARRAVAAVAGEGNTNIGAGLQLAAAQVVNSPVRDGLRRLVLVSDGNANTGEFSQDALTRIAARIAGDGTSITSVGLGIQYSEAKMRSISAAGRGNYYFVEDATQLASIFSAELGSVGKVVAVNARLELSPSDNLEIVEVFSYGARQDGSSWIVPLVDLAAGDTRKIVARVRVKAPQPGALELATALLVYRPVDAHQEREITSVATVEVTNDVAAVRAGIDTGTVTLVQEAETAKAIDEASEAYARDGYAGAQQVLDRQIQRATAVAADLDAPGVAASSVNAVEKIKQDFAAPPAKGGGGKAIKRASEAAYGLAK
jgi:Ca-activated chloride channel family protein